MAETIPGGIYIVNGQAVDSEGRPVEISKPAKPKGEKPAKPGAESAQETA